MAMTYYFPWVRKGLGMFIQEKDAYTSEKGTPVSESDLALNRPEILLTAEFLAQQGGTSFNIIHEKTVKFVGPSDIAGVSEKIVMKAVPDPSTTTFPRQYFPYVEFYEPDFPWRYSPAAHNEDKLRPWVALVCCPADAIQLKTLPNGARYCNFIGNDKQWEDNFLKPDSLWRAAHAQGSEPDRPELARLLALRNATELEKDTDYVVLLIPAFETGRLRGLGKEEEDLTQIPAQRPSWDEKLADQKNRENGLMFPVYSSWSFTCGDDDFEAMVERLKYFEVERDGIVIDVSKMGEGLDYDKVSHFSSRRTIEMPAATKLIGSKRQPAFPANDKSTESILYKNIRTLLEQNPVFVENESDKTQGFGTTYTGDDDPLVVPPVYGARHVLASSLDEVHWVEQLNMDVHYRAAAGLGKSVVQTHQEELMNRAWKQVNAVNALNVELYNRLLSLDTNKALQAKLPQLVQGKNSAYLASLMRILGSMADASNGKVSLSSILGDADIPKAFASATFQKTTDQLARLVAGMDATTLMERLVQEQFYRKGDPVRHDAVTTEELSGMLDYAQQGMLVNDRMNLTPMIDYIDYDYKNANTLQDGLGGNKDLMISSHSYSHRSTFMNTLEDEIVFRNLGTRHCTKEIKRGGVFFSDTKYYLERFVGIVTIGLNYAAGDAVSNILLCRDRLKEFFEDGYDNIPMFGYVVPDDAFYTIRDGFNAVGGNGFQFDKLMDFSPATQTAYPLRVPFMKFDEDTGSLEINLPKKDLYLSYKPNLVILPKGSHFSERTYLFHKYRDRYYMSADYMSDWRTLQSITVFRHTFWDTESRKEGQNLMMLMAKTQMSDALLPQYIQDEHPFFRALKDPQDLLAAFKVGSVKDLVKAGGKDPAEWMQILAELYYYFMRAKEWFQTHPSFMIVPEKCIDVTAGNQKDVQKYGVCEWKKGDPVGHMIYIDQVSRPWKEKIDWMFTRDRMLKIDIQNLQKKAAASKPTPPSNTAVSALQQALDNNDAYDRMREVAEMYYQEFFADNESGQALRDTYLDELLRSKYPILAYPQFPEPTSYYLKLMSEKFIVPGCAALPDDSVALFETNTAFIEAFLCGMNTEMGQELMWREYPTDRRGSYFRKFWDSESTVAAIRSNAFFDIKPVHTWTEDLGGNHQESKADLLIFTIKGTLLRQFPSTQIYLQRAVGDMTKHTLEFDKSATEENGGILRPVMETFLKEDTLLVGFKTDAETALGNPANDNYGYFLAFEEDVEDLNFQHAAWSQAKDAAKTADKLRNNPSVIGKHVSLFVNIKDGMAENYKKKVKNGKPTGSVEAEQEVSSVEMGTPVLSKPEAVSCDGVYQSATRVHVDLGKQFDRDSFELAFDFNCWSSKSPNDNILVLDTSYRSLIVGMKDGKVRIGINNGSKYFATPITVKEETWQHIDLVYKAGVVTINGNVIKTGTMNGSGNNILSSNNFSNGHCFKGTIRNLVVKNC